MFQKLNVTEYIKEHLKTLSFQDSLRELKNKTKGNFTRLIQQAYNDFKPELDEIFSELKQTDFKYIGLYIQGKLKKCPECGKFSENTCCSRECYLKHNYALDAFSEILKEHSFEDSLRIFHKQVGANFFTVYVNKIYPHFKSEFDELLKKIGSKDTRFISLFIEDKLSKCKVCGKTIVKPRIYCGVKCYVKGTDYAEIVSRRDYVETGRKISKTLLSRTDEERKNQLLKSRKTKLERYGNPGFTNPEKMKQTCFERYSETSYCKTDEFKKMLTVTAIKKYKHCEDFTKEYFEEHFIDSNGFLKINECSEYFNVDKGTIYKKLKFLNVEFKLSKGRSIAEKQLFEWIPIENKIHNDRTILNPKELDMVIPDYNLAIEYNGVFWHSLCGPDYHQKKTLDCLEKGLKLFQIFETDNIEIWKSMILNALGKSKKIFARKCVLKQISSKESSEFLNANHLQGSCGSSIRLGLYYNNELVQLMTFGKPRFNKNFDYELLRFCTLRGHCVIGGASKIFNYFRKNFKGSVISYCNLRYSNGNIYKQLGFTQVSINKPSYFYVKNCNVLSRYQCQKHKLKNLLENFDPNLTETENMQDNGYVKVYDSGSITYILS